MEFVTRSNGCIEIIEMTGRFDAYVVHPVISWIDNTLLKPIPQMVFNLSGVNFIDSTALSIMVHAMKRARDKGGDVVICNLQQSARVIFELTRLNRAFDIFDIEEVAVNSLGSSN
jgi:anti-sigma B factor antagonist